MPKKGLNCQDIIDNLVKIDRDIFPFFSLDETEMIIIFTKKKVNEIRKCLKSLSKSFGFRFGIHGNEVHIKIKKVK